MVQSKIKTYSNDIDKVTGMITKNNVGVKTAERLVKGSTDVLFLELFLFDHFIIFVLFPFFHNYSDFLVKVTKN